MNRSERKDYYRYLGPESYEDAWINGGKIRLTAISTYKRAERKGIYTIDEGLIHDSTEDLYNHPIVKFQRGAQVKSFSFTGSLNGKELPKIVNAKLIHEGGAVLCFSSELSSELMHRFEKTRCIKINDMAGLLKIIDGQLKTKGQMGWCEYTKNWQRHHFLKSDEDAWQKEFRLFWKNLGNTFVEIPPGVGTEMTV